MHCLLPGGQYGLWIKCGPAGMRAIAVGRKVGAVTLCVEGELRPHLTQCRLGRGLPPYQVVSYECLPYFYTWCGPSAKLECRSETCCTQLAGNAGPKKIAIWAPSNNFIGRAVSSQLRHISTIRKNVLSSNISPTCPYNIVNFGLLADKNVSLVLGHPS